MVHCSIFASLRSSMPCMAWYSAKALPKKKASVLARRANHHRPGSRLSAIAAFSMSIEHLLDSILVPLYLAGLILRRKTLEAPHLRESLGRPLAFHQQVHGLPISRILEDFPNPAPHPLEVDPSVQTRCLQPLFPATAGKFDILDGYFPLLPAGRLGEGIPQIAL